MNLAPASPARAAQIPQSGTGVPCQVAQCDGVPCAEVTADCEHCDRSTNRLCDEHRDATGDASADAALGGAGAPSLKPNARHA